MIKYAFPDNWIKYNATQVAGSLANAKAAVLSLQTVPYQRSWVESLQKVELKREVAGTSQIEGAEFTDHELEQAISESPEALITRSQKQARAAMNTYQWIVKLPDDRPIGENLILEIHRNLILGADDDHCPPGKIRGRDENVSFGQPRHRGADGGEDCERAFKAFSVALNQDFKGHDKIIQAIAGHYHLAAMHPFLDGNGRTARAVEALLLQRAGLKNIAFIAMSNYYYDEKIQYLKVLGQVREENYDLTAFINFALTGIEAQSKRLLAEIQREVSKALFRNLMYDLFNRLKSTRKRVIIERQIEILKLLLENEKMDLDTIVKRTAKDYNELENPFRAVIRDLRGLIDLGAIVAKKKDERKWDIVIRLNWPTEITETDFYQKFKSYPKAKTHPFL